MDQQYLFETAISDNSSEREFFLQVLNLNFNTNYEKIIESLVDITVDANSEYNIRAIAAFSIKSKLYTDGSKWHQINPTLRNKIQKKLVSSFNQEGKGKHLSALIISAIIYVECQYNNGDTLLTKLICTSSEITKPELSGTSLTAISYMYDDVGENNLKSYCKDFLDAIVFCIDPRWDTRINFAACQAMTRAVEYAKELLSIVKHGNVLIKCISDCIESTDDRLIFVGLESISLLVCTYYDVINKYLDSDIIKKITKFTKHRNTIIIIKAIYFWSALSVIELERVKSNKHKTKDEMPVYYYSRQALPYIIPSLFDLLCLDVARGDDIWSAYDEIYEYLDSTVQFCFDEASELLLPLIEQSIYNIEAGRRDASMITLGILIKHCNVSCIDCLVSTNFPLILRVCNDPSERVRESAFWALGNLYERFSIITRYANQIQQSLIIIFLSVEDVPKVAFNVLRALSFIVRRLFKYTRDSTSKPDNTFLITEDYQKILDIVFKTLQRSDVDQSHLRQACIGLMKNLIMFHPYDAHTILIDIVEELVKKYSVVFLTPTNTIPSNKYFEFVEINAFYNEALQESFKALEMQEVTELFPTMFWTILNFFTLTEDSIVKEQLLVTLNVLITYTSDDAISVLLTDALPILLNICKIVSDMSVSVAAVVVIYNICTAVGTSIKYYCDDIIDFAAKYLSISDIDFKNKELVLKILKILIVSMDVQTIAILPDILGALDGLNTKTMTKNDNREVLGDYERFLYNYFDTYSHLLPLSCQRERGIFTPDSYSSWNKFIPNILKMIDKMCKEKFLCQEVVRMYSCFFGELFVASQDLQSSSDMKKVYDNLVDQASNSTDEETKNMANWLISLFN